MSDIAIQVEHMGKQYRLGGKQVVRNFQETLLYSLNAPIRWIRGERQSYETFWALNDISFEIREGEAVGIIGRNGAGKSTLLKILSRITKPTKGHINLYGRVASLLEVGTGFHSELTGRDNIYLNGAILGMTRREISRKFDEIVDFSGVEKFLDTPVKHYSSGMYVRLAFAVAAHLEPEILIVDEVLAVGDAEFQRKCLGKMGDVANEGRTVLFVSHNMAAIEQLCQKAILLENGNLAMTGVTSQIVRAYLQRDNNRQSASINLRSRTSYKNKDSLFTHMRLRNQFEEETIVFSVGDALAIDVTLDSGQKQIDDGKLGIVIENERGQRICNFVTDQQTNQKLTVSGKLMIRCNWPEIILAPGRYSVNLSFQSMGKAKDVIEEAVLFEVVPGNIFSTGRINSGKELIWPRAIWTTEHLDETNLS